MISSKTLKALEYDKIMADLSSYAVLEKTKEALKAFVPLTTLKEVDFLLKQTSEAFKYLYTYSTGSIYYFDDITDELNRVDVGSSLNNAELLRVISNFSPINFARIIICLCTAFSSAK